MIEKRSEAGMEEDPGEWQRTSLEAARFQSNAMEGRGGERRLKEHIEPGYKECIRGEYKWS